jgi:2-oxo-3-hexenedioate decarboxylase
MRPEDLLRHADTGELWPVELRRPPLSDLAAAYGLALQVRERRIERGERPMGFKVGFTNRTIWERYQVFAPIWGTVWNTTVQRCDGQAMVDLIHTCQPRLEPEIVFGISRRPPPQPDLQQLFECVEWLAPGFEVVQSHCADWKFTAAETVADAGLHARLLVGRPLPTAAVASDAAAFDCELARRGVHLYKGDERIESGLGRNVLDGPLHALLHFVHELQRCPEGPPLEPGDVVTTGTWTDAWPVRAGDAWHAEFDAPIGRLAVVFR